MQNGMGHSLAHIMASGGWKNASQALAYIGQIDAAELRSMRTKNGLDKLLAS